MLPRIVIFYKRPLFTIAGFLFGSFALAAESNSNYDQPQQEILDVMRAQSPPTSNISPTQNMILLVSRQDYPSISRVSTPFLRLAGTRVEIKNHSKHDTLGGNGIKPCVNALELVKIENSARTPLLLPDGACAENPQWSADGKYFAFTNVTKDSVELWVGDSTRGKIHRVPSVRINPMLDHELKWMPDQKHLLVKLLPEQLGLPPSTPLMPNGPNIQVANGEKGQSSTYESRDTLGSKHDEDLFDYYANSQLALVDVVTSKVTRLGKPANFDVVSPAPDGHHILVSEIHKPYSYVTTYKRFPHSVNVWNISQPAKVKVFAIADLPLADRVPIHGESLGPRNFDWRPTDLASLVWAEALDEGDWNVKVPNRDKVMLQKAPFLTPPIEIIRTEHRFQGLQWTEKSDTALLYEYDKNRHWMRTFVINIDNSSQKPRLIWDRSINEKYSHLGSPVMTHLSNGERVIRIDSDAIYLSGQGSSPDGDRPFLNKLNLNTLETVRLFRSDKDAYERFMSFKGKDYRSFYTSRETVMEPPNVHLRVLGSEVRATEGEAVFSSTKVAITQITDPTPSVRAIQKRIVKYKRADGIDLSFTLYTPPGYIEGTRIPTILHAYPKDYADASTVGQIKGSQATFTRLRSHRLLLLAGYALIDDASFPIVGDPKRAYDTYTEQLVADAKAAVDEAVRLGVADLDRIGVTGHSHGALMTVNLLVHSNLFRAGVATSGSYNKTLTPFGFQNETRSIWEAPDVYQKVSPFFYADKLKTPLLIVHGADDANPGTTPLQASKLFEAIRGNGGIARLVMLPHEPHWYTALESNEQLVFEMVSWFDRYLKN